METIKLLKKGIKVNGAYFPCHYSTSENNKFGNATIYIRGYKSLPKCSLTVINNTDSQIDYFERDKVRISPNSPYFAQVEKLAKAA